ncbi:MAG: polysaccharide pyruvyl transferase family protein, partial [Erythrobacter sp.]|nr:polysaccharide pyruvyl transferase family protein [Erythrobacter sp.]
MKSKVLLHGMHRSPNFGDVLLTQILRDHLLKSCDDELLLLAPSEELVRELGLREAKFGDFLASDTLILGGGGFFQRVDGPLGSLKAVTKYALPLFLARILGKRTAIIGAGAAAMPRRWLDLVFKRMVKGCDIIAVRDQASFDYVCTLLGVAAEGKIHRVSDLAFSIDESWLGAVERAWASDVIRKLGTTRVLGVHLSEPPSSNPSYEAIAALLESHLALEPDTGVLLLEDHPFGPKQQAAAQAELQRRLPNSKVLIVPYPGVERL